MAHNPLLRSQWTERVPRPGRSAGLRHPSTYLPGRCCCCRCRKTELASSPCRATSPDWHRVGAGHRAAYLAGWANAYRCTDRTAAGIDRGPPRSCGADDNIRAVGDCCASPGARIVEPTRDYPGDQRDSCGPRPHRRQRVQDGRPPDRGHDEVREPAGRP